MVFQSDAQRELVEWVEFRSYPYPKLTLYFCVRQTVRLKKKKIQGENVSIVKSRSSQH